MMRPIGRTLLSGWMAFGGMLELVVTGLVFTLLYLIVIGPAALWRRVFSRRPAYRGEWVEKSSPEPALERLERQF